MAAALPTSLDTMVVYLADPLPERCGQVLSMLCKRISSRHTFWALADIAAEGVLAGAEVLLAFAVRPAAVYVSRAVICLHAASQANLRRADNDLIQHWQKQGALTYFWTPHNTLIHCSTSPYTASGPVSQCIWKLPMTVVHIWELQIGRLRTAMPQNCFKC